MTIAYDSDQSADEGSVGGVFDAEFKPLTADEAQQWRRSNPALSPWVVVVWQLVVGAGVALVSCMIAGINVGLSAGYGAVAVVVPAALMVRGLGRQREVVQPGAVMLGFMVWELVKIALTVAMLLLAPKVIRQLSWLALVAGFVVTMKVYWVAAWLHSRRRNLNVSN